MVSGIPEYNDNNAVEFKRDLPASGASPSPLRHSVTILPLSTYGNELPLIINVACTEYNDNNAVEFKKRGELPASGKNH